MQIFCCCMESPDQKAPTACRVWLQVEAIDQTLGAILTDLGDVYDAFMILWWRVLSGATPHVVLASCCPVTFEGCS